MKFILSWLNKQKQKKKIHTLYEKNKAWVSTTSMSCIYKLLRSIVVSIINFPDLIISSQDNE